MTAKAAEDGAAMPKSAFSISPTTETDAITAHHTAPNPFATPWVSRNAGSSRCPPGDFPGIPGLSLSGPVRSVYIERSLRFPWSGGLHPWLDAVIETDSELVAVESKRFEPFRSKQPGSFSEAYLKPVWGPDMDRFQALRDAPSSGAAIFERLDAVQLVKHALGLLTQASKSNKKPVLVYLYAEPRYWPDGTIIPEDWRRTHRAEIERFADAVSGDLVSFRAVSYFTLLEAAQASRSADVKRHAQAVAAAFQP